MNKLIRPLLPIVTFTSVLALMSISLFSCSQSKFDQLDELLKRYAELGRFSGSVLVAHDNGVIYKNAFGLSDHKTLEQNSVESVYHIGSITKQFTAMLILQLAEENKLDLHSPISTYLPDYPKENGERITIHHLLTHTSGIPEYSTLSQFQNIRQKQMAPLQLMELFATLPLDFNPGRQFSYCNSDYVVLGVILENVTQTAYADLLEEKILNPLNMTSTGYHPTDIQLKHESTGYYKLCGEHIKANTESMSAHFSARGMHSTVDDLFRWNQALNSKKLVSSESQDLLFKKHVPAGSEYHGYGWQLGEFSCGNTTEQVEAQFHFGGVDGFRSVLVRIPETESTIILLSNTECHAFHELIIDINGILQDKPYELPEKRLATSLYEIHLRDYAAQTEGNYEDLVYDLVDNELMTVGTELLQYSLLKSGKREEPFIHTISAELNANSYNIFSSYAEAKKLLGDKLKPLEAYANSIEERKK